MKKKKKFTLDINKMGVNIDKNEYNEIVLSNSSRPWEIKGADNRIKKKEVNKT